MPSAFRAPTASVFNVNQAAHGFVVGNVVRLNGSTYALAQADSASDAEVAGIVSAVLDTNTFTLLTIGKVTGLSGLTAGSIYFLDPSTPGALTTTEPSGAGQVSKPLLIADSTTTGFFYNFRGEQITSSTPGAQSAAGLVKLYDSILSADAASFDTGANAIPPGYDSIVIVASLRSTAAVNSDNIVGIFNNDSSALYNVNRIQNVNTAVAGAAVALGTSMNLGDAPGANATANLFGSFWAEVSGYDSATNFKSGNADSASAQSPVTASLQDRTAFSYQSQTPITQLKITPGTGGANWKAGSRLTIYGVCAQSAKPGPDGWISDSGETWTFASSTTFTVQGDATAKYTVGTRIRLTQSASVKYFVVTAAPSLAAGVTTVTISGGTDFTLANAAITGNYHSYEANPQGYPTWFNFDPSPTGWTATPTKNCVFALLGKVCTVQMYISGTSNATTAGFTLPITPDSGTYPTMLFLVAMDNGNYLSPPAGAQITTASATLSNVTKDPPGNTWTASGTKRIYGNNSYKVA